MAERSIFLPGDGRDTARGSLNTFLVIESTLRIPPVWNSVVDATQKFINQEIVEGHGLLQNQLSFERVEHGLRNISHQCVQENIGPAGTRSVGEVIGDLTTGFGDWRRNALFNPDGTPYADEELQTRELILDAYTLGALASFSATRLEELRDALSEVSGDRILSVPRRARVRYWEYVSWVASSAWQESVRSAI